MSIYSLRTFSDPFYTETVPLDGTDYVFDWRYNQREKSWYFSIATSSGDPLASGVKVVCGVSLLGRFADLRLPPGVLMALSNTSDASPPGLTELGQEQRVTLIYFDVAEVS